MDDDEKRYINKNELLAEMVRKGHTYSSLSSTIGISAHSLSKKMNEATEFTISEIWKIKDELKLNDILMTKIFSL